MVIFSFTQTPPTSQESPLLLCNQFLLDLWVVSQKRDYYTIYAFISTHVVKNASNIDIVVQK